MTGDSLADAKTALLKAVSNVPAARRFTTVAENIGLKIGKGTGKPAVRRFLLSPPTRFLQSRRAHRISTRNTEHHTLLTELDSQPSSQPSWVSR